MQEKKGISSSSPHSPSFSHARVWSWERVEAQGAEAWVWLHAFCLPVLFAELSFLPQKFSS